MGQSLQRQYHAAVNGMGAQSKLLNYTYLSKSKNITLSEVVMVIIDVYLPDYQKYLIKNYQMSDRNI